jgi:hypothetical protein
MYPLPQLLLSGAIVVGTAFGVFAQDAPKQSDEQVCQDRADELKMAANLRDVYMRECVAGERLERNRAGQK